jgi:hypothetical protein
MTNRKAHYLDPTSGTLRPSEVIFFDTETRLVPADHNVTIQVLKLGVAWHCRTRAGIDLKLQKEYIIRETADFWGWVNDTLRPRTTTYIVAHNIVFDLTVLHGWEQLASLGWGLQSFYTKGITSIFRWTKGNRKIIGVDNTNLFPGKLARWGDILGKPKLSADFDTITDSDLLIYCRRDVEIMSDLWRLWLRFLDDNDCGSFKPTVGSTAFNTWRHQNVNHKVFIHADPQALLLERESYHGARVECLFKGRIENDRFYYLDVNNMYGWVLSRYEFPSELLGVKKQATLNYLARKLQHYNVIARVALNVTENIYPYRYEGHICYPLGQFDITLTTPELIMALQHNWIMGIGSMAWYKAAPLFRDYVLHWHKLRHKFKEQGNSGQAEICKLLINSLYGKFGQQGFDQKIIGTVDPELIQVSTVYNERDNTYGRQIALGGILYEENKSGEAYHSFPAIAAHVTAYARLHLARLVAMAGAGNCFYMDTDSLLVNERGKTALTPLLHPTQMGLLKEELSSSWIEINAPKDYAMADRQRIKGIRENAIPLGDGAYQQEQWIRFNGLLRAGNLNDYTVSTIIKHQLRQIYSGQLQPSGWVKPFYLQCSSLSGLSIADRLPVPLELQPMCREPIS